MGLKFPTHIKWSGWKLYPQRLSGLLLLLCLHLGWLQAHPPHDFHVSVMRMDYNPSTRSLEVSLKLFSDDIEESLQVMGGPRLHLGAPNEYAATDSLLNIYLHNRLGVNVNGQDRDFELLGKEVEYEVTWCYLEFKEVEMVRELVLRNEILFELFDDQSNIVHLYLNGKEFSMLLHKGFREDSLKMDE